MLKYQAQLYLNFGIATMMLDHLPKIGPMPRCARRPNLRLWTGLCLALCALSRPAYAEFTVCNQSFDIANLAMGQQLRGQFETRGWWKIGPNQCAQIIADPLVNRFVYVFATDVFGKELLAGSVPMCIAPDRFQIEGETECLARGYLEARFIEIDTQDTENWTLFLTALPE